MADEVVVEGAVKGDINARDQILIKNGAVVKGTIQTQKLLFEEGGEHNGLVRLWKTPKLSESIMNGLPENPNEEKDENKTPTQQKSEDISDQQPEKTLKQKSEQKEPAERLW